VTHKMDKANAVLYGK